jgi:hypothetical protein
VNQIAVFIKPLSAQSNSLHFAQKPTIQLIITRQAANQLFKKDPVLEISTLHVSSIEILQESKTQWFHF